jgi:hypothetical protein
MSDESKAIVQRFLNDLWNTGDVDALDNLMDPNCDGDFSFSKVSLWSSEEAFSAVQSESYGESGIGGRIEDFSESHPELAKLILKRLIIQGQRNFREIVKSRARTFRQSVPDVQCVIEELAAKEDMVWARWTLRGTFQPNSSDLISGAVTKPLTLMGASIFLIRDGKIQDYRSQSITTDRWFESVVGLVPRP